MLEKLDAVLNGFTEMGIPGWDCIVMQDGKVVYRKMDGFSDYERTLPVSGKERYNLYSCSKPITCVAALKLWEEGKYKLSDKLSDYMPEFENMTVKTAEGVVAAEKPILIKNLFTMTSGFDYGVGWPIRERMRKETNCECATRDVMREFANVSLPYQPDAQWQYGLSHDILAGLVEVISGERFGEYVRKNIFEPLGMDNSTFLLPDEELDTISAQYRYNAETKEYKPIGPEIDVYKYGSLYESGGAGVVSTVEDYIKFLEALRVGDVILKKETIDLMTSNILTEEQAKTYWRTASHGYGLGVRTPKEGVSFDFGWGGAAGSFLLVDRTHNVTMFYAQHVLSSPNGEGRDSFGKIVAEEFSGLALPQTASLSEEVLKKYL